MPQFETTFLVSQIFWLLISFGCLYLGVRWLIFPLYDKIFDARERLIKKPVEEAEELLKKIEVLQQEVDQKKQAFSFHNEQRLNQAYQRGTEYFNSKIQKTDKMLNRILQKKVQKMEHTEKGLLKEKAKFITDVLEGAK